MYQLDVEWDLQGKDIVLYFISTSTLAEALQELHFYPLNSRILVQSSPLSMHHVLPSEFFDFLYNVNSLHAEGKQLG
jgi:hypothetical protein